MDLNIIITGIVAIISSIITSIISWFTAKRKYNTEVDSNEIDNLRKSLDMYKSIIDDVKNRLEVYIKINEDNMVEIHRLKSAVHRVLNSACLNTECTIRQFYTEEQIKTIINGREEKLNNGTDTGKEVF